MDSSSGSPNDEEVVYGAMPPTRTKKYTRAKKSIKQLVSSEHQGGVAMYGDPILNSNNGIDV